MGLLEWVHIDVDTAPHHEVQLQFKSSAGKSLSLCLAHLEKVFPLGTV